MKITTESEFDRDQEQTDEMDKNSSDASLHTETDQDVKSPANQSKEKKLDRVIDDEYQIYRTASPVAKGNQLNSMKRSTNTKEARNMSEQRGSRVQSELMTKKSADRTSKN